MEYNISVDGRGSRDCLLVNRSLMASLGWIKKIKVKLIKWVTNYTLMAVGPSEKNCDGFVKSENRS